MPAIIIADTPVILPVEGGGHKWSWYYRLEPAVNGVSDGTYERVWTDPPELEVQVNAEFPAQIAARANLEAVTEEFTASSVYGGRIA
jgi:hypothetical protein